MTGEGLRERNKARRREAITRAALTLFAERGYDETTIAEVAEAAEVSPGTVKIYFGTKQDLALARFSESADRFAGALHGRLPGEKALDVLERWLRSETGRQDEVSALARPMFRANPKLRALLHERMDTAVAEFASALAEDAGLPPDSLGPRLAAASAAAMIMTLGDFPNATPEQAVRTAMTFLESGLQAVT
ncbi:helix-turn-helix domain-containing protein [Streptomyces mirabilis]|uniref:TetR/AcrR family transcriptional regulator n=1 Tax=Streptomyces mirabilis TaxID=68239 RepID=UPI003325C0DB